MQLVRSRSETLHTILVHEDTLGSPLNTLFSRQPNQKQKGPGIYSFDDRRDPALCL